MIVEIKEGHYYRRQDGKVEGPAKRRPRCDRDTGIDWEVGGWFYGDSGIRWNHLGADPDKDLIEDLGQVDPRQNTETTSEGMSLRDRIALEVVGWVMTTEKLRPSEDDEIYHAAKLSYRLADAMIAAREEGGANEAR